MDNQNENCEDLTVQQIREWLKAGCDELTDEMASNFAADLFQNGLRKRRRLSIIKLETFTKVGMDNFQAQEVLEYLQSQPGGRAETAQIPTEEQVAGTSDQVEFKIDWKRVYYLDKGLKTKLTQKKRLSPKERTLIAEEIVAQVRREYGANANRKTYDKVYKDHMPPKYRESFIEVLGAHTGTEKFTKGGILNQMQVMHDNAKRPDRKRPLTQKEKEAPHHKATVGCIRWRVASLPDGVTLTSLEELKENMKTVFHTVRIEHQNSSEILANMAKTFKLQRDLINTNMEKAMEQQRLRKRKRKGSKNAPEQQEEENNENEDDPPITIADIMREFPFLFTAKGMMVHFKELTGVDAAHVLTEFIQNELDLFLEYFGSTTNPDILSQKRKLNRILKREGVNPSFSKLLALLRMLPLQFEEESELLVSSIEDQTEMENIDPQSPPEVPHLIAVGNKIANAKKFYFALDQIVLTAHTNEPEVLAILYMSYMIFNLNYHPQGQVTLEFIQRVVFKHVPEKGHKRPASREDGGRFSTSMQHPAVDAFLSKVNDWLALRNNLTSEEEQL